MEPATSMTPKTASHFEIDNQLSDWRFKYGYYRITIPKPSTVKNLALPDPAPSFPDIRGEKRDFTTVPEGGWNIGHLTSQPGTHKYSLLSTEKTNLARVSTTWYPHQVDWMALNEPERSDTATFELQSAGFIFYNVYSNHFGLDKVIVSSEWIPESVYGVDHETQIYALIDGHQIAPRFLAHITEHSGIQDGNKAKG
jgi:hypothetical protein